MGGTLSAIAPRTNQAQRSGWPTKTRGLQEEYVDDDGNLDERHGTFIYSGLVHELPWAAIERQLQRMADKAEDAMAIDVEEEDEDGGHKMLALDNVPNVKDEVHKLEEETSHSFALGAKPKGVPKKKVRRGPRHRRSIEKQGKHRLEL